MYAETYKSKSGRKLFRPVLEADESPFSMDSTGFCLACGLDCSGVEPDARRYTCESCGEAKVYGLEELCLMDLLKTSEGAEE